MNRIKKALAYFLILCIGAVSTGCIGPFKLTNVTYHWNETIGSKWMNELIFVLFIPVYAITFLIDGLILNPIEFWTDGPGYSMKVGEKKRVASKDGESEYLITRKKDGYHFKHLSGSEKGRETFFRYNKDNRTWSLIEKDEEKKLVQLLETKTGAFVKVFKEDGTSALVDANLRDRDEILKIIDSPPVLAKTKVAATAPD